MTKPHIPEALTEEADIETYAVIELNFEERFKVDHKIKFTITDECETEETLKLECDIQHYFILSYIINKINLITRKLHVS